MTYVSSCPINSHSKTNTIWPSGTWYHVSLWKDTVEVLLRYIPFALSPLERIQFLFPYRSCTSNLTRAYDRTVGWEGLSYATRRKRCTRDCTHFVTPVATSLTDSLVPIPRSFSPLRKFRRSGGLSIALLCVTAHRLSCCSELDRGSTSHFYMCGTHPILSSAHFKSCEGVF